MMAYYSSAESGGGPNWYGVQCVVPLRARKVSLSGESGIEAAASQVESLTLESSGAAAANY